MILPGTVKEAHGETPDLYKCVIILFIEVRKICIGMPEEFKIKDERLKNNRGFKIIDQRDERKHHVNLSYPWDNLYPVKR